MGFKVVVFKETVTYTQQKKKENRFVVEGFVAGKQKRSGKYCRKRQENEKPLLSGI